MFLEKLILLNWGQVESGEYQMGQVTLFTGGTGAGKTTMSDAIQTLLTAAKDGLFAYNPGQEEASQRSREKRPRTLQSYILGADLNEYARPGHVYGYVAGIFVPSPGESAKPFSALLGVEAHLDSQRTATAVLRNAVLDDLQLFTLEGIRVGLDDLVQSRSAEHYELWPTSAVYAALKAKYAGVTAHGNNKRAYLERLYGLLKGATASSMEAEQAAKSFSRFMAYKPLDHVNDFVRYQVLETHDIESEVTKISGLMRDVAGIRKEVERIRKNLDALNKCQHSGKKFIEEWGEHLKHALCKELKGQHDLSEAIERGRVQIENGQKELRRISVELDNFRNEKARFEQQQLQVQDQRRQNQAAVQKDTLELDLERARSAAREVMLTLAHEEAKLSAGRDLIRQLRMLPPEAAQVTEFASLADIHTRLAAVDSSVNAQAIGSALRELARKPEPDQALATALLELAGGLDQQTLQIKHLLTEAENSPQARAAQASSRLSGEFKKIADESEELRASIAQLAQGRVTYPGTTQKALDLLSRQLPQSKPRVLCDLVEPRADTWQVVIEAYMGDARYGLIVEPDFEAQARRLVTSVLGRNSGSVIQGALAQRNAERITLPPRSIVHELDIADPIAKAYVTAQYGTVEQVDDLEQLRHIRRGVTLDGHGSAGYRMFGLNTGEALTFGREARQKTKERQEQKLRQLEIEQESVSARKRVAAQLQRLASEYQPAALERAVATLHKSACDIADLRQRVDLLDLTEVEELDKRLQGIKTELADLDEKRSKRERRTGELDVSIESWTKAWRANEQKLEQVKLAVLGARGALTPVALLDERFAPERIHAEVLVDAENDTISLDEIEQRINAAAGRTRHHKAQFRTEITTYNGGGARASEQIVLNQEKLDGTEGETGILDAIAEGVKQVNRQIRTQTDFGLTEREDQLKKQSSAFNTAFTSNFCQLIYASVRKGQATIRELNRQLKERQFGEDSYRFEAHFVPGMKKYFDLFDAISSTDELGESKDLFSEGTLAPEIQPVLQELLGYLLDADSEAATKRLAELADYRNYHRYEIWKEVQGRRPVALSTYGTASGGQFETPAYVIRLAAISSAFRLHERHPAHLRLLVTDEAFGHMDEARARAILDYIVQVMGFQVVFIVPNTRSAGFLDQVSHQYMFAKVPAPANEGELKHKVLVQWQEMNRDTLPQLWREHRERVVQQAAIEFENAHAK